MSTIVCPVDFKEASFRVARLAATIAGKTSSRLVFLHSLTEEESQVRDRMQAGMQRLGFNAEKLMGSNFSFMQTREGLVSALNQMGKTDDIGLVVMATDGLSSLREFYSGSRTENVAGKTPYPILVVPAAYSDQDFSTIVFASDYENTSLVDTESLLLFAQLFNARVNVVHISKSENPVSAAIFEEFREKLTALFGKENLQVSRTIGEDVSTGLLALAVEQKADLIAVHKDHFDVNDGSKTDTFLRMAEFPMLILKK